MSERHACRLVGLSRDSYRHAPVASAQTAALKIKIVEIAHARRRFGYRRVHDLLRPDFPGVNHKRVYRLYTEANLTVRKRKKVRRPPAERTPLNIATKVNEVWSMDKMASGTLATPPRQQRRLHVGDVPSYTSAPDRWSIRSLRVCEETGHGYTWTPPVDGELAANGRAARASVCKLTTSPEASVLAAVEGRTIAGAEDSTTS
jgi:hypothetical protein